MPREQSPLWIHPSGQWCKKHRGLFYYFGNDQAQALERYRAEWDDIIQGKTRRRKDSITLEDLCTLFLVDKRQLVDNSELTSGSWGEYHRICDIMTMQFGSKFPVGDFGPDDFKSLRQKLATRYGPRSLRKYITLARSLFSYAFDNHLIEIPVRYGTAFDVPSKKTIRLTRQGKGSRLVSAEDCQKLLSKADPQIKTMILLGLNCGYGQQDCASLTSSMLAVRPGWIEDLREKTATPRRAPLWKETIRALAEVERIRPPASCPENDDCVFLTVGGLRWVRRHDHGIEKRGSANDDVAVWFRRLTTALEIKATFYDLRHTFRTIADEVPDRPAIDLIMGHADNSMAADYRETISDERLLKVSNHVHRWLFAGRLGKKL